MKKKDFIKKYGEEQWLKNCECSRRYRQSHKKEHVMASRKSQKLLRLKGITPFCKADYEQIENYDLAKVDEFNPKKWVLHHRDESMWKSTTLIKRGEYYNLTPDKLIWLPYDEHAADKSRAIKRPDLTKWHQRIFDR